MEYKYLTFSQTFVLFLEENVKLALNLSSFFFFTEKKPSNGNRLKVEAKRGILPLSFSRAIKIYKTKIPAGIGI